MGRKKRSARGKPRVHPRGVIEINRAGFGFVKTAEGDFFIPRSGVHEAFDGDLVEVARTSRADSSRRRDKDETIRPEARVVRVIDHAHTTLIGRYEVAEPFGIVIPDDTRVQHDVFTKRSDNPTLVDGSLVRVAIDEYPTRRTAAFGHVIEVLGDADDACLSSERIIARNDLPISFSDDAMAAVQEAAVDAEAALASGYRDIRERFVFTIDPDDAKDFDDALSVDRIDRYGSVSCAWRLGVHIADVSSYVPWNSALDMEARKRATSVYLADRVIPMLPEHLSNDVCSLRPGEERRCLSIDVYIQSDATLVGYEIYPSLIRSDMRLTYHQALDLLQGKTEGTAELVERLRAASALAQAREAYRESRGGIGFQTKEAKVRLDASGHPVAIDIRVKNEATTLIEEAMIFANEIVAEFLDDHHAQAAFRVHEPPHKDALEGVVRVLREFKWFTSEDARRLSNGDPFAIQRILAVVKGHAEVSLVTSLLLRAMTRATYQPDDEGHYGLGLSAYCHFTSPIRRYPDLIVHRVVKALLAGDSETMRPMIKQLPSLCEHCSEAERTAETAARESQETKMAEYFQEYIGHEFDAVISGVTTYGLYIQLDCTAEGLIPIRSLGSEYFMFDTDAHMLIGQSSGVRYRLGQPIRVTLLESDPRIPALTFGVVAKKSRTRS